MVGASSGFEGRVAAACTASLAEANVELEILVAEVENFVSSTNDLASVARGSRKEEIFRWGMRECCCRSPRSNELRLSLEVGWERSSVTLVVAG